MYPSALNTSNGGIDKDTAKSFTKNTTADHIENMRLLTDEGGTTGALINVKGNSLFIGSTTHSIPDTTIVYKVVANTGFNTVTVVNYSVLVDTTIITFSTTSSIEALAAALNASSSFSSLGMYAALSVDKTFIIITRITGSYNFNSISITVTGGNSVSISTLVPALGVSSSTGDKLIPIGYTTIKDTIILLTAANSGGYGQIWRIDYDRVSLLPTFTLVYNNNINLSAKYPVPPSAIESRYERADLQRIYWTDFNNHIRVLNTADPNSLAVKVEDLDFIPPEDAARPRLLSIDPTGAATLYVGTYQAAYRLTSGALVTPWSELSNIVSIVSPPELDIYNNTFNANRYFGDPQGTKASKQIKWIISGIDTDYTTIETCVVFRDNLNSNPIITITQQDFVPITGVYEFIYDGTQSLSTLTLNEFLADPFNFSKAKTLMGKDNRLLAANTTTENIDFTFDSRVYRFPPSTAATPNSFTLFEDATGGSSAITYTINTSTDFDNIGETLNLLDPITLDPYSPTYAPYSNQKYKQGTTILGGTGKYISYEIKTKAIKGDVVTAMSTAPYPGFHLLWSGVNSQNNYINNGIAGQDYPSNLKNDGFKNPNESGVFRSYQHNETYRFAIEFYDKQYRPLFSRWIGDIKMPDYWDYNTNPPKTESGTTLPNDFRLSYVEATGTNYTCWLNQLYVEFTVNIPASISSLIGGYRIVRTQRTEADRTVVATGIMDAVEDGGGGIGYLPGNVFTYFNVGSKQNIITMQSPDFLLGAAPNTGTTTHLILKSVYNLSDTFNYSPTGATDPYDFYKYYSMSPLPSSSASYLDLLVSETTIANDISSVVLPTISNTYSNFQAGATISAVGAKTLVIVTSSNINYAAFGGSDKYLGVLYNPKNDQYGKSYASRTLSEYIPAGEIVKVSSSSSTLTFTESVFGGDIYLDIFDNQRAIKNWGGFPVGSAATKLSKTWIFPTQSVHNFVLRHGLYAVKDVPVVEGIGSWIYGDTYDYNFAYSNETNVRKYFPKPFNFISTNENQARIWYSDEKIDGETIDSWRSFAANNYQDADGNYGAINALVSFKDDVLIFQDSGLANIPMNQKELLPATGTSGAFLVGSGSVLLRPDYISNSIGCRHAWSISTSENNTLFYDSNSNKLFTFNQGLKQLSDIKGIQGFMAKTFTGRVLDTDNPVYEDGIYNGNRCGVVTTYDKRYNEFLITFIDSKVNSSKRSPYLEDPYTFAYNEQLDVITSFYSFYPSLYINDSKHIFTPNPQVTQDLYTHNIGDYCNFYGNIYESKLRFYVNENYNQAKIFNNFEWETEVYDTTTSVYDIPVPDETWTYLRAYTNNQISDYHNFNLVNQKPTRKNRTWRYIVPRNDFRPVVDNDIFNVSNLQPLNLFRDKMKDKVLTVELRYDNSTNHKIIAPFWKTIYIPTLRITGR